jgi:Cu-Zn family superoxide dismutase
MRRLVGGSILATMMAAGAGAPSLAADITVKMLKATQDGTGESLGTVTISDSDAGASFKLALHGLAPGQHGFHVNENDNCGPTRMNGVRIPAGAAGGHYDPDFTGKHAGPLGDGHLGDLPVIEAEKDGSATETVVAPRIKDIETLKGHALIIQIGGDNYKDTPYLGGGGGGRFACGSIE